MSEIRSSPRIPPLTADEMDDEVAGMLSSLGSLGTMNIFRTFARHSVLFRVRVPFSSTVLHGLLPAWDRELLILQTAHRCHCAYEWAQHVRVAQELDFTDEEIRRIAAASDRGTWSAFEAALLDAADELIDAHCISDKTWSVLSEWYDEKHLIEVPVVVGHYYTMAIALNSFGVQLESDWASNRAPEISELQQFRPDGT